MVSALEAGAASRVSTVPCPASPALSPAHGHLTPPYLQPPTQQGCPTAPTACMHSPHQSSPSWGTRRAQPTRSLPTELSWGGVHGTALPF